MNKHCPNITNPPTISSRLICIKVIFKKDIQPNLVQYKKPGEE